SLLAEGRLTGGEKPKRRGVAEDVAAAVRDQAAQHLGRRVGGRAEVERPFMAFADQSQVAGQAEVSKFAAAAGVQNEIFGLDVAVQDALAMRGEQRFSDLPRD